MNQTFRDLCDFDLRDGAVWCDLEPRHSNPNGFLHGGMASSLLDTAMGMAVMSQLPPELTTVTVSLTVNFLDPGFIRRRVVARGEVLRSGNTTAYATATLRHVDDGSLIATASGVFALIEKV